MKTNNTYLEFFKGFIKSFLFLFLFSAIILLVLYGFDLKSKYISNALFIPNSIIFIVSIGINIGAANLFNPLNYTTGRLLRRKKSKEMYVDYADYLDQKKVEIKNYWYLTLASLTLLVSAFVFTLV